MPKGEIQIIREVKKVSANVRRFNAETNNYEYIYKPDSVPVNNIICKSPNKAGFKNVDSNRTTVLQILDPDNITLSLIHI